MNRREAAPGASTNRAIVVVNVLPRWISDFNEVSTALVDAGYQVTVYTSAPDPDADSGWRSAAEVDRAAQQLAPGIDVRLLPYSNLRVRPWAAVRAALLALRHARRDPDALFVLWTGIPTLTWGPVLRTLRRRVLYMVTGLSPVRSPERQSRTRRLLVTTLDRWSFRTERCRILVHNRDDKAFLDATHRLPPDRVVVTPGCGVDPEAFPFSDPDPSPHTPVILVPVRLLVDKGVLDAAGASARLAREGLDHEMWFTSNLDPTHPTALTQDDVDRLAAETPTVRFLGYQESLVERYARCDVACVPTYFPEGLPTALLEAASSGRVIVTTDNVGGRDFVRDGIDGLVVPPRSPDALAAALGRLLRDRSEADRMRRSAHRRFLDGYTKEHMVAITLDTVAALGFEVRPADAPEAPAGAPRAEAVDA
jgi:glycosyltransferase involved in cell wall biosynthesis